MDNANNEKTLRTSSAVEKEADPDCLPPRTHALPLLILLRCIVKAYLSGYAISAIPPLIRIVLRRFFVTSKLEPNTDAVGNLTKRALASQMLRVLKRSLSADLPWFMFVLVGGFRVLDAALWEISRRKGLVEAIDNENDVDSDKVTPPGSVVEAAQTEESQLDSQLESLSPALEPKPTSSRINSLLPSPTFVAGAVSSSLALLVIPRPQRSDFAVFTAVRALDSFAQLHYSTICAFAREKAGVPNWVLENLDTGLFVISSAEIMYSWIY